MEGSYAWVGEPERMSFAGQHGIWQCNPEFLMIREHPPFLYSPLLDMRSQ